MDITTQYHNEDDDHGASHLHHRHAGPAPDHDSHLPQRRRQPAEVLNLRTSDSGLVFQVKVRETLQVDPSSLGSGERDQRVRRADLNLRTTTSQKCEAVPRRAHI